MTTVTLQTKVILDNREFVNTVKIEDSEGLDLSTVVSSASDAFDAINSDERVNLLRPNYDRWMVARSLSTADWNAMRTLGGEARDAYIDSLDNR